MGVTYRAFDVDLHCPVTLKVISEKYLGDEFARLRFLREARAAARLRHSNVASVLHLGKSTGKWSRSRIRLVHKKDGCGSNR
jgi:serine/threonine protein kinase